MRQPLATYRLQLRDGTTLADAEAMIPGLADFGISHLYLSPIFRAVAGSTHGYDVIDPNEIDPAIGGREGLESLAAVARRKGMGIILDIVPNHLAFTIENAWLADVLRWGEESSHAPVFDIDWENGPLLLPFLPEPFETMMEKGAIALDTSGEIPVMVAGDLRVPLRPDVEPSGMYQDGDALRALHDAQHWRLTHWMLERDSVTHRRFFNITGLIGVRVEDPAVLEATHRGLFKLIDAGLVQGLRLDHIDGLADPATYLERLRARVGDMPIWVEKILSGDETLPDWPIEGTTGYEGARRIAMFLTDAAGYERIVAAWQAETGRTGSFDAAVREAKREVMQYELSAELHQLIELAARAADMARGAEIGKESLREAILALLFAFPRYRTYFSDSDRPTGDLALMQEVADVASERLRGRETVDLLHGMITNAQNREEAEFRTRFQQISSALLAKSHEDTAAFRWNACLGANEVGADPGDAALDAAVFEVWARNMKPTNLTLTSSHDTKRSEDARMRLVAMTQLPAEFLRLWEDAGAASGSDALGANLRWYIVQSVLAVWDPVDPDLTDRLRQHTIKAMREAKRETNWTHPDTDAESMAADYVTALVDHWREEPPPALGLLIACGESLSLGQVALKLILPAIPDFYQNCFGEFLALTDPDNRRTIEMPEPQSLLDRDDFSGRKARLSQCLLGLRKAEPGFFATARTDVVRREGPVLRISRDHGGNRLSAWFSPQGGEVEPGNVWPRNADIDGRCLAIDWH